jgi:hypothetical protein
MSSFWHCMRSASATRRVLRRRCSCRRSPSKSRNAAAQSMNSGHTTQNSNDLYTALSRALSEDSMQRWRSECRCGRGWNRTCTATIHNMSTHALRSGSLHTGCKSSEIALQLPSSCCAAQCASCEYYSNWYGKVRHGKQTQWPGCVRSSQCSSQPWRTASSSYANGSQSGAGERVP